MLIDSRLYACQGSALVDGTAHHRSRGSRTYLSCSQTRLRDRVYRARSNGIDCVALTSVRTCRVAVYRLDGRKDVSSFGRACIGRLFALCGLNMRYSLGPL